MASETPSQSEKITLTVRIIKSFEYRTTKNIVLHGTRHASATDPDHPNPDFSLDTTNVADLKEICKKKIATTPGFKPFLNTTLDCMKLYFFAHGQKTSNLIINVDKDEVYMDDNLTLAALNIDDETEISFFEKAGYEAYKSHPDTKW